MNRIERKTKVQANKVNANCNFLFDACIRLISLPCVLVIAKKPAPAFCSAKAVSDDKAINAMHINSVSDFTGALNIT